MSTNIPQATDYSIWEIAHTFTQWFTSQKTELNEIDDDALTIAANILMVIRGVRPSYLLSYPETWSLPPTIGLEQFVPIHTDGYTRDILYSVDRNVYNISDPLQCGQALGYMSPSSIRSHPSSLFINWYLRPTRTLAGGSEMALPQIDILAWTECLFDFSSLGKMGAILLEARDRLRQDGWELFADINVAPVR